MIEGVRKVLVAAPPQVNIPGVPIPLSPPKSEVKVENVEAEKADKDEPAMLTR